MIKKILETKGYSTIPLKKTKNQHLVGVFEVNDLEGLFLIDTGASNSCIRLDMESEFSLIAKESSMELSGAGNEKLNAKPTAKSRITYKGGFIMKLKFFMLDMTSINKSLADQGSENIDGILGADFLKRTNALIDYKSKKLFLKV